MSDSFTYSVIFYNCIYICLYSCFDWFPPADNFWRNVNNAMSAMGSEFPILDWVHCSYSSLVSRYLETEFPGSSCKSPTGDGLWLMTLGLRGQMVSVRHIIIITSCQLCGVQQQGFMETKQEQDCLSVVKKSIRYIHRLPIIPLFFSSVWQYIYEIRDNDPCRDGSKTGPCSG